MLLYLYALSKLVNKEGGGGKFRYVIEAGSTCESFLILRGVLFFICQWRTRCEIYSILFVIFGHDLH